MRRFLINFRKNSSERAAEISARAYNHYLRIRPFVGTIYRPIKSIREKYLGNLGKKYGKS